MKPTTAPCLSPETSPTEWQEVSSRLETICGWLSHLDERLKRMERDFAQLCAHVGTETPPAGAR